MAKKAKEQITYLEPDIIEEKEVRDSVNISATNGIMDTIPKNVVVGSGKTLRLIALEYLGNKEFWIYIYLLNKSKIKNPNIIIPGITLRLPTDKDFDINPHDPASVNKAKTLGDAEIEKFKTTHR